MCDLNNHSLTDCIKKHLDAYFEKLDGHQPADLYHMVQQQMEIALLSKLKDYTNNNQCHMAEILGINRGTLRKKLFLLEDHLK